MDRLMRARVLLAEAEALGVTIEDLVAASSCPPAAGSARRSPAAPTLAEYVDTVAPSFSANTAATYRSYWRVAVARFGGRPIDSLDADDCEAVLADAVARAQRRRPGSDGRSSRENCVAALRALFGRAERAGLLTKNPARELDKPRRRASRRRALDDTELAEALDAVRTTSQDPDLDLLLVRFHLDSGARREGALSLRLGDLDRRRSTALLREKFGLEREQPIPPSLVVSLEAHARERGATGGQTQCSGTSEMSRSPAAGTTPCSTGPRRCCRGRPAPRSPRTPCATPPAPPSSGSPATRWPRPSSATPPRR